VAKTPPAQLAREIAQSLGLPPDVVKKWRSKIKAYKRAVAVVEGGDTSTEAILKMAKARDALDKAIYEAGAHVPYVSGQSWTQAQGPEADAIHALQKERDELVSSTFQQAQDRGREARSQAHRAEVKRIEEKIREANRPYEWMKR
jgi:hypothetical protein